MRRLLLASPAVITFAVPASLAVMAAAPGTAGAASAAPTCKKLTGSVTSNDITITKCSPKGKADKPYKTATGSVTTLENGSGNITWNGGATTAVSVSFTEASTDDCPGSDSEYTITGSVTGGSTGNTYTASGQLISADVCVTGSLSFTLLKKTEMDL